MTSTSKSQESSLRWCPYKVTWIQVSEFRSDRTIRLVIQLRFLSSQDYRNSSKFLSKFHNLFVPRHLQPHTSEDSDSTTVESTSGTSRFIHAHDLISLHLSTTTLLVCQQKQSIVCQQKQSDAIPRWARLHHQQQQQEENDNDDINSVAVSSSLGAAGSSPQFGCLATRTTGSCAPEPSIFPSSGKAFLPLVFLGVGWFPPIAAIVPAAAERRCWNSWWCILYCNHQWQSCPWQRSPSSCWWSATTKLGTATSCIVCPSCQVNEGLGWFEYAIGVSARARSDSWGKNGGPKGAIRKSRGQLKTKIPMTCWITGPGAPV